MAIFHLTTKIHGRTQSTKLNAVRALAYRNGMCIKDPNTGKYYNSSLKAPEVIFTKQYLPANAPAWMVNSIKLWARIEKLEKRCDAQIFRELEASFPIELGPVEWQEILDAYVKENFTDRGMAFSAAIHNKHGNPHFHGMATLRSIEGDDFGNKNREWNHIALVYKFRQSWEKHVNAALEKYGFDARISCKSYKDLEIDKVPTVHVPPEYKPKRSKVYTQKRDAAIQHNEYVQHVNNEKVQAAKKAKKSKVRTDLLAGHHGASLIKFLNPGSGYNTPPVDPPFDTDNNSANSTISLDSTTDINNGVDIVVINAPPIVSSPELSPDEIVIRSKMRETIPNADELFNELGRVRTGLGRTWNWGTFKSQYERIDKSKPDLLDAFLVKELVWIFSKKPELASTYTSLVAPIHLQKSAKAVKSIVQFSNPDALPELKMMIDIANRKLSAEKVMPLMDLPPIVIPTPIIVTSLTYKDALSAYSNVITDIDSIIAQCDALAKAGDKAFTPEILKKRIERMQKDNINPYDQDDLVTELLSKEFYFIAKKRPEKVKDALDTIPSNRRQFYESIVANVIGEQDITTTNQVEVVKLSADVQIEIQSEKAIKASCSDFDIKDYHARFEALSVFGITYTWTQFKEDIQRYYRNEAGHARTWWTEKLESVKDAALEAFRSKLPKWFTEPTPPPVQPLPVSYPLGAYEPNPEQALVAVLQRHRELHPEIVVATKKYNLEANGISVSVDTLDEIMDWGIEHKIRTCDVSALRVNYFHQVGFAEWEKELNHQIVIQSREPHGQNKAWLREQFELFDPTDVAGRLGPSMAQQIIENSFRPAPSPTYSSNSWGPSSPKPSTVPKMTTPNPYGDE